LLVPCAFMIKKLLKINMRSEKISWCLSCCQANTCW
jgi:hypothetical protein